MCHSIKQSFSFPFLSLQILGIIATCAWFVHLATVTGADVTLIDKDFLQHSGNVSQLAKFLEAGYPMIAKYVSKIQKHRCSTSCIHT